MNKPKPTQIQAIFIQKYVIRIPKAAPDTINSSTGPSGSITGTGVVTEESESDDRPNLEKKPLWLGESGDNVIAVPFDDKLVVEEEEEEEAETAGEVAGVE